MSRKITLGSIVWLILVACNPLSIGIEPNNSLVTPATALTPTSNTSNVQTLTPSATPTSTLTPPPTQTATLTPTINPTIGPTATSIGIYSDDEDRESYGVLYEPGNITYPKWDKVYQEAISLHATWLENPQDVALQFLMAIYTGWPADGHKMYYLPTKPRKVIIILIQGAEGETIGISKWRVELVQQSNLWQVEWAGLAFKCTEGMDTFTWHPDPSCY